MVHLYQRSLDCPNIRYTIILIINSDFKDFNFLILPKINCIYNIEKTMIFVDSIKISIALKKYLQSLLSDNLKNRGEKIIISFLSNLDSKTKTDYLKNCLNSNTMILICMEVIRIEVNIPDIKHIIY